MLIEILLRRDLSDIIDSKGLEATFHDLCQIVGATLHHTAADTLVDCYASGDTAYVDVLTGYKPLGTLHFAVPLS